MTDNDVSKLLQQLHGRLEGASAGSITDKDREQLRQIKADIQNLLAKPGGLAGGGHETVIGRLQSAVTQFEVSHPEMTATMAQVSKALADMGI